MIYDICIIGSGQSGLTTCKTFIEKGYNVIILEKNYNSNGLFSSIIFIGALQNI
jgi:cation diffusion facilitator CzcD-associated flavoprotein CzcO